MTFGRNSSEATEEQRDRMTEKKRTLGFFYNIPKKKRRQTLLRPDETRSALCQLYQSIDYMFSKNFVVEEETKVRVANLKPLGFLLQVVDKELKEMNGKIIKNYNKSAQLPADLMEVVERKGGKNLKLVITKLIYTTDLNAKNNRFQIPWKKIVCSDFLSQEEKDTLKQIHNKNKKEKEKEKRKGGVDVTILIEPSFEEHNLKLREWPMKKNNNYVLVSGWNSAIKNEKESRVIKEGDMVQLWSFRCHHKLWFLLHKVRDQSTIHSETVACEESFSNQELQE